MRYALGSLLLSLVLVLGCDHQTVVGTEDAGPSDCTADPCACCTADQVCVGAPPACCTPQCGGKGCGPDGCGGTCGTCETGLRCNTDKGTCECPTESDDALCLRLHVVCGKATGKDACGNERSVDCDGCASGKRCDQASTSCLCPETDAQLCARLGAKECGALAEAVDSCGDTRAIASCGTCPAGESCSPSNTCELCTPLLDAAFCASKGIQCGRYTAVDDCTQQSRVAECPSCAPGFSCNDTQSACEPCVRESVEEFCQRTLGDGHCGTVSAEDNCRIQWDEVDCGGCEGIDYCDTRSHHCRPCGEESDQELCARHGTECGPLVAEEYCGQIRTITSCGTCAAPGPGAVTGCTDSGRCETCQASDGEVCGYYFMNCGTPVLTDRCGLSLERSCGTCPPDQTCQPNNVCGDGVHPTNDTCEMLPERLVFDASGRASASGDLTHANMTYVSSCFAIGPDVLYLFTLAEPRDVRVELHGSGDSSHFVPTAFIRTVCSDRMTDVACSIVPLGSLDLTLKTRTLAPGDYYLGIQNFYEAYYGPFTFTITATPPPATPPSNDTCATATVLSFNGSSTITVAGDTTHAANDYRDSCPALPGQPLLDGGELVYKFTLDEDAAVVAQVTRAPTQGNFLPMLELLSTCPGGGAPFGCANEDLGVATVRKSMLAAGDYYLVVAGRAGSFGDFTLQLVKSAPVYNDICSGAEEVALAADAGSGALVGSVEGDTRVGAGDYDGCNVAVTGRDLVYRFTIPAGSTKNVRVDLDPEPGSALQALLYLRTACPGAGGAERGCAFASQTEQRAGLQIDGLGEGTYYVVVDGFGRNTDGPFTLTITALEPPPRPQNDECAGATPLTLANGWTSITGTTRSAVDDYRGVCSTANDPHSGPDLVYRVTTRGWGNLAARVRIDPSSSPLFKPAVYVQTTCGDSASERACGSDSSYIGAATATLTNAPGGDYFVIVDGLNGSVGEFTLDVAAYTSTLNDNCATAKELVFDDQGLFSDVGDLCAMARDSGNVAGGGCAAAGGLGPDVVYRLDITAAKSLSVSFDGGQSLNALIYVQQGSCGASSSQIACSSSALGSAAGLELKNLSAGTYYIWLDNEAMGDCGPFRVQMSLVDPPVPPDNDRCAGAALVELDATSGLPTIVSGTTDSATDETSGSCGATSGGGGEVVYAFTLSETTSLEIIVRPDASSTLQPIVYLQTACGVAATERGCGMAAAPGDAAHLQFARLGQGSYYLVVDSSERFSTGSFLLELTARAPGPPAANDRCAAASSLGALGTTAPLTVSSDTVEGNDDDMSFCAGGASGPDLVHYFTLDAAARVTARVTRGASSSTFLPAVSIRHGCALSDEVACGADSSSSPAGSATATSSLAAGTWYVFVDGLDDTFGPFTLELTRDGGSAPIAGDGCGNAIALDFHGTNVASAVGDLTTAGLGNDGVGSCASGWLGPDVVYSMTLAADAFVTVELAGRNLLDPGLYLRRDCNDPISEIGCASSWTDGGTVSVATTRLSAGRTYYLFADSLLQGTTTYAGPYTLTVTATPASNPAPVNDVCRNAKSLQFDIAAAAAHETGDTRDAVDDYRAATGNCGSSTSPLSGGDVVYAFDATEGATVIATVTRDASTPSFQPALVLRSSCGSASSQLACDATATASGTLASVSATNLTAGTYYLVVDGQGATGGLFALDVFLKSAAVTNSSCALAEPLVFSTTTSSPGVAVAEVLSDTRFGQDQTAGVSSPSVNCYSSGAELYYSFETSAVQNLSVALTPLNSKFGPTVYLRRDCADPATQVACGFAWTASPVTVNRLQLPQGRYTLIVDTYNASDPGPFRMKVTLQQPPPVPGHDTCSGGVPLVLPSSGTLVALSAATVSATDDYTGSCATSYNPFTGPDVVYTFTPATDTRLSVRATPTGPFASWFRPALYLRTTCEAVNDDACAIPPGPQGPANLVASVRAGVPYYLIVDGIAGTAGDFELSVAADDSRFVAGDQCTAPIPLDGQLVQSATDPTLRTVTLTGTTEPYAVADDFVSSCSSAPGGGDLVYSFTLTSASRVEVSVGPQTSSRYQPVFSIRTTCADLASEQYCALSSLANRATSATLNGLPPGTYYLLVDAYAARDVYNGPFSVTVGVGGVPVHTALNETCASATPLAFQSASGGQEQVAALYGEDSTWAGDDAQGGCYSSHGGELVYRFTTTQAQSFSAQVVPDAAQSPRLKPVVYLRSACDAAAAADFEYACAKQTAGGNSAELTAPSLPAGNYWLYVDSFLAGPWELPGGRYSLVVTLGATSLIAPANDSCRNARDIPLVGPAPSLATLSGQTTVGAADSTAGTCASGAAAGDVAYTFELTSPAKVSATVTFSTSGAYPAVYLRKSCDAEELACASSWWPNNVTATVPYLPAGRYYVWVDGTNSTGSTFQLDLAVSSPEGSAPPANCLCAGPLPSLTRGVKATGTTVGSMPSGGTLNAACGSAQAIGPNVVYTYTPDQDGFFRVALLTTGLSPNSWDLLVWMSDKCLDAGACLAFNNSGYGAGAVDALRYYGYLGKTYYVVVSSTGTTSTGNFELTVE